MNRKVEIENKIKLLNKKIKIEIEVIGKKSKMKLKLKQDIGMSVVEAVQK